jgi:NADPH2:quinone reductase
MPQTTHAIRLHEHGGPEVLKWEEVSLPDPGPGEVLIRHTAVGLNFIEIYQRSGLYKMPLPSGLGQEAAGVVEAVGPGVTDIAVGDRIAYAIMGIPGAYAEKRLVPAEKLVKLPDGIADETAAAAMLAGMTARYLIRQTCPVRAGDKVLFHAAAGGVGLIACQWLKALGAFVIGTVSTPEKAELARQNGCDHVLLYSEDIPARVRELTGGTGVRVAFDGVGKDTFEASLNSLAPLGMLVTFGNASGPVPAVEPLTLAAKGSLFLTRPTLGSYIPTRETLLENAADLFDALLKGHVTVTIGQRYPLKEAAQAQIDMAARRTVGSTVLIP